MHESNGRSTASAESRASERRGRDDSKSLTIPIPSSLQRGTWRFSAPLSHLDTAPPSTGAVNDLSHFVRDLRCFLTRPHGDAYSLQQSSTAPSWRVAVSANK